MKQAHALSPPVLRTVAELGAKPEEFIPWLLRVQRHLAIPEGANVREIATIVHRHLPAEWRGETAAAVIDGWIAQGVVRGDILEASQRDCRLCGGAAEIPDDIGLVTPQMLSDELATLVTQVKLVRERRAAAYLRVGNRIAAYLEQIADDADFEDEVLKSARAGIKQAKDDRIRGFIWHVAQDLVTQLNQLSRPDLIPPDILDAFETIDLQAGR